MCSHLDEIWPSISIYTHCVLLDRKLASTSADSYNSYTITLVLLVQQPLRNLVLFVIYDSHSKVLPGQLSFWDSRNITSSDNPYDVVLKFLTGKAAEDNVPQLATTFNTKFMRSRTQVDNAMLALVTLLKYWRDIYSYRLIKLDAWKIYTCIHVLYVNRMVLVPRSGNYV